MALCLTAYAAAEEYWIEVAHFTFDEDFTDSSGNAIATVSDVDNSPEIQEQYSDGTTTHMGVLYLDGSTSLKLTATDGTPLLTNATELKVSFDYCSQNTGTGWPFFAAPNDTKPTYQYENYLGTLTRNNAFSVERYLNGRNSPSVRIDTSDVANNKWHHAEIIYAFDNTTLTIDGKTSTEHGSANLKTILGNDSVLYLGRATWITNNKYEHFQGYIDNVNISVSYRVPASVTLNPFNVNSANGQRPHPYDNIILHQVGSDTGINRLTKEEYDPMTITLPTYEQMCSEAGFKLTADGEAYALSNTDQMPYAKKLVGWYNIKTGEYYDVTKGPKTATVSGKGNVFYAEWLPVDYDFMPANNGVVDTTGTIPTVDTAQFIEINMFDYTDLVNLNAAYDTDSSNTTESWDATDNRTDGHLAFFNSDYNGGTIGKINSTSDDDAYQNTRVTYNIIQNNSTLISQLFNPKSTTLGVHHIGKGNYLFSYDANTGKYSYNSKTNGAVYQQSEDRFYVLNTQRGYSGASAAFFPLNAPTGSLAANNGTINYWFGMSAKVDFWLPDDSGTDGNQITDVNGNKQDMTFSFTGDDDLWVLIDGNVVLDLGGVHDSIGGTINFSTGNITITGSANSNDNPTKTYEFSAGEHTMEVYYMERGGNASNCQIEFNLLPKWEAVEPGLDVVKIAKNWDKFEGINLPNSIEVELYDTAHPAVTLQRATLSLQSDWAASFAGLPHQDENNKTIIYGIREANTPHFNDVHILETSKTYKNCWVFTDANGLASKPTVLIGNGNGQVLSGDCEAVTVHEMDTTVNIIKELTAGQHRASQLEWQVVPRSDNANERHFYLQNNSGKYLLINANGIQTVTSTADASRFYLNASGDLQDAKSNYRLAATATGFTTQDRKAGNDTHESSDNASLYTLRTSETTAYAFNLTNTFLNPAIYIRKVDHHGDMQSGATMQILDKSNKAVVATWTSGTAPTKLPVNQAEFHNGNGWLKLSTGNTEYVYILTESVSPTGYHPVQTNVEFKLVLEEETVNDKKDEQLAVYVRQGNNWVKQCTCLYNQETKQWNLASGDEHLTYRNTYDTGNLSITKTIQGSDPSKTDEFTFTVKLTKGPHPLPNPVTYTIGSGAAQTLTLNNNGEGTLVLTHGQTAVIKNLPHGTEYTVTEQEHRDYQLSKSTGTSGTIDKNGKTAAFENAHYSDLPTLTISKTVKGNAADPKADFAFTLTLTDSQGQPLTGSYHYTKTPAAGSNITGTETLDSNGSIHLTLKHGERITFIKLPVGATYTVTEDVPVDYTVTPGDTITGTIESATGAYNADFVNEKNLVSLVKKVSGLVDQDTVTPLVVIQDAQEQIVFSGKLTPGVAQTFYLPHGTYTLTESDCDMSAKDYTWYSATLSGVTTTPGTKDNDSASFTFTIADSNTADIALKLSNVYTLQTNSLSISKTVVGSSSVQAQEFTFTVKLTNDKHSLADSYPYAINGGDTKTLTLANGESSIVLQQGETAIISGLPIGTEYIVTETPVDGYTTTKSGDTGIIENATSNYVAAFTNTRTSINLKKVTLGLLEGDVPSSITVTLSQGDSQITSTTLVPNDTEYTTVELTPGNYIVTESDHTVDGYTLVSSVLTDASDTTIPMDNATLVNGGEYTLTNTYEPEKGSLSISKTVVGNAASPDDSFTFTVKLTEGPHPLPNNLTYIIGEISTPLSLDENGAGSIVLTHGETAIITGLPIGTEYTVTEAERTDYVLTDKSGDSGIIDTNGKTASFTNARYAVKIQKTAEGLLPGDTVTPTISVDGTPAGSVEANTVDVLTVYLQSGSHTLTESNHTVEGYELTSATLDGNPADTAQDAFTFTLADDLTTIPLLTLRNVYAVKTGNLEIRKTVTGNAASASDAFTFTVTLARNQQALTGSYPVEIMQGETTVSSETLTFGTDGKATVSLTGGQRAVISGLPMGTSYTVEETLVTGYKQTDVSGETGSIEVSKTAQAAFVNTKDVFSDLTISKTIHGTNPSTTDSFEFTVTLTDPDGTPISGTFTCTGLTEQTITFDDGEQTIFLHHNESVTIKDLPYGTNYTVTEMEDPRYTPDKTEASGTIDLDGEQADFVNTYYDILPALKVTKQVQGNAASTTDKFDFTVKLDGMANQQVAYLDAQRQVSTLPLDEDGSYTFDLAHGEHITFIRLPVGADFTITEDSGKNGYALVSSENASGSIEDEKAFITSTFVNERNMEAVISKVASGLPTGSTYPTPTVSIYRENDMTTPVWSGQVEPNEPSKSIGQLPDGNYVLVEDVDGVTNYDCTATVVVNGSAVNGDPSTASTGVSFSVKEPTTQIAIIVSNAYTIQTGSLTITKTVEGAGNDGDSFEFTVSLTDEKGTAITGSFPYSGTTDGATAVSGNIASGETISLQDGGSITISGIPVTTKYTVTEKEDPRYTADKTEASGTIDLDGEQADFVNTYYDILPALKVTKQVQGNAASTSDKFDFTVKLDDMANQQVAYLDAQEQVRTLTLDENGKYTFTLAHGEHITFIRLPVGADFFITEDSGKNGYALVSSENASGSIEDEKAFITSTFVNERNMEAVISKVASGLPTGITYPTPTVSIYRENDMTTPVWSGQVEPNQAPSTIGQLPDGNYVLIEKVADVANYDCTATVVVNGSAVNGDPSTASTGVSFSVNGPTTQIAIIVSNAYVLDDIPLEIAKRSTGLPGGGYPSPVVSIYREGDALTPVWTGTLTPNGDALQLRLLPGTYTLVEQNADVWGYHYSAVLYVDGSPASDNTFTLVSGMETLSLLLDNAYMTDQATLTLSKKVIGSVPGMKDTFSFVITLTDGANVPVTATFPYTGTLDGTKPISGTVINGSTVSLMDGGSIRVTLPLGIHYKVEELPQADYLLTSSTGTEGVITPSGAVAAFVNSRQVIVEQYSVEVRKEWLGDSEGTRPTSIQIQLMLDGKPFGEPVTLSWQNGWKHTFTGLEASGTYSVVELNVPDGYQSTVTEIQPNVFVITNSLLVVPPTGDDAPLMVYTAMMLGSLLLLSMLRR